MIQVSPISLFIVILVSVVVGALAHDRFLRFFTRVSGYRITFEPGCKVCSTEPGAYFIENPPCLTCFAKRNEEALAETERVMAATDAYLADLKDEQLRYEAEVEEERLRYAAEVAEAEAYVDEAEKGRP